MAVERTPELGFGEMLHGEARGYQQGKASDDGEGDAASPVRETLRSGLASGRVL